MQEAAKDLLNAEEEAVGEEHGGERRVGDSVGEEEGPALMDGDFPEEEEESNAGEGVGEEAGGALMEEPLPEEGGGGEKQGRVLGTVFGEVKPSADKRVGEDAGTTLNGEEQGDTGTEEEEEGGRVGEIEKALMGEGELCLRLGLKAEGAVVGSVSMLGLSIRLGVSKEGREEGRLSVGTLVGDAKPCWSGSLDLTEKHRFLFLM